LTAGYSLEHYHPVVLVTCGSFNPPTFMHLRMLELAQQQLTKVCLSVN
jgi:nicotinic acid mononucleotide adenylyltransferase